MYVRHGSTWYSKANDNNNNLWKPVLDIFFLFLFSTRSTFNPLLVSVECRGQVKICIFLFKKFQNSHFHYQIGIQHEKCIHLSTNKPSIGPVVLEITSEFEKVFIKIKIFLTKRGAWKEIKICSQIKLYINTIRSVSKFFMPVLSINIQHHFIRTKR